MATSRLILGSYCHGNTCLRLEGSDKFQTGRQFCDTNGHLLNPLKYLTDIRELDVVANNRAFFLARCEALGGRVSCVRAVLSASLMEMCHYFCVTMFGSCRS